MKRLVSFVLSVCFLLSASLTNAAETKFYDKPVVFEHDGYVQLAENGIGSVCRSDGSFVLPNIGKSQLLMNGYILVQDDSNKFAIYGLDGTQRTEWYSEIPTVVFGYAVCGEGDWVPPGMLRGSYGAIDLESGQIIAPIQYDEVRISADGQYVIGIDRAVYQGYPNTYTVYDRAARDVTASAGLILWEEREPFMQVLDPQAGRFGLMNEQMQITVPVEFAEIRAVSEASTLVMNGTKLGICSADGTGTMMLPMIYEYDQIKMLPNGMYAAKKGGSLYHQSDGVDVEFYFSDGGRAPIYGYRAIQGALGDILFCHKADDDTLYCLSITGQVLGRSPGGYLAFSSDDCDFVLIGRNGSPNGGVWVNRWGEQLPTSPTESILSSFSGGKGLALWDAQTNQSRFLMADGTEMSAQPGDYLDADQGLILRQGGILDLYGNEVLPQGSYARISDGYFSIAGQSVEIDGYLAEDERGRFTLLPAKYEPYEYAPHDWAVAELGEAITLGLIEKNQQRDWRDACTRADFCQMLMVLLRDVSPPKETRIFADTKDTAILKASAFGIVNGVGNGKFAPNRPITRQEAAVMLARTATVLNLKADGAPLEFTDEIAPWAVDAVAYITAINNKNTSIMQGTGNQEFSPLGSYTREQSIITIFRLYQAIANY